MSGGYIKPQKQGDHQIVVFTFVGPIDRKKMEKWNMAIFELKKLFGDGLTGITIQGDPTPPSILKLARKRKK
jgi:hypothetical protein